MREFLGFIFLCFDKTLLFQQRGGKVEPVVAFVKKNALRAMGIKSTFWKDSNILPEESFGNVLGPYIAVRG